LELSGIKNITSKIIGTNNKVNNAKCTMVALQALRKKEAGYKKQPDGKPEQPEKIENSK
jgi:ribosomal protein S5